MATARHVMKPPNTHMTSDASPSFFGISDAILALSLSNMANNTKDDVEVGNTGPKFIGRYPAEVELGD